MKLTKFVLGSILAAFATGCNGGSPTAPTPSPGCPTGVDVSVEIVYRRRPEVGLHSHVSHRYRINGQGRWIGESGTELFMLKTDDYTWKATIVLPENSVNPKHAIEVVDFGLLPAPVATASDIYMNGVLVTDKVREAHPDGGTWEYGRFRIDGCGKVTP